MRVLVYGVGVIGTLTVHALCAAGNEVTVVARGKWREVLTQQGLVILCGKKRWTDHPRVLQDYDGAGYDAVFSIMQNQQQAGMMETLAGVKAAYTVLVSNNLQSAWMERRLRELGKDPETVLFAFQTSGGLRHADRTEVAIFGRAELTIGHRRGKLSREEQAHFKQLFQGSCMKLAFEDDMESWYHCHAAFVLPAAYLSYANGCDLHRASMRQIRDWVKAGAEAYALLQSLGFEIRPKGDDKNLRGIRGAVLTFALWIAVRTRIGELALTGHCRNALAEMRALDAAFAGPREQNPDFPMPCFDVLRNGCPTWEALSLRYGKNGS